jgi:hypothetical protein
MKSLKLALIVGLVASVNACAVDLSAGDYATISQIISNAQNEKHKALLEIERVCSESVNCNGCVDHEMKLYIEKVKNEFKNTAKLSKADYEKAKKHYYLLKGQNKKSVGNNEKVQQAKNAMLESEKKYLINDKAYHLYRKQMRNRLN